MVAPATMQQVVRVESRGNVLAIGVNGGKLPRLPRDAADAAMLARAAIRKGYSVDLGLMQVNSRNLANLGYSVEDMFEPCKNLAAGAKVLATFYQAARPGYRDEQAALRAALSAYNTGSYSRGLENGYVAKYTGPGARTVPELAGYQVASASGSAPSAPSGPPPASPYTITSTVFSKREGARMTATATNTTTKPVISTSDDDALTPGVQVEHTAASAERAGAFEETALSEADAWDSNADLHSTAIVIDRKRVAGPKE